MAISHKQLWEGDSVNYNPYTGQAKSVTMHYMVTGTTSEREALDYLGQALKAQKTPYDGGAVPSSIAVDSWMSLSELVISERMSLDEWKIDATYTLSVLYMGSSRSLPPETVSFSNQGNMQHVNHSRQTVSRYANTGRTAIDFHGAVGVNANGDVDGCDIYVNSASMTITHYFTTQQFSASLRNRILLASGWMNDAEFRGFERGELLFIGSNIQKQGEDGNEYWQVDYTFGISPDDDDVEVEGWTGPTINKNGWNYLWVYDRVGDQITPEPDAVYVERFYKYRNFEQLGLKRNG